MKGLSKGRYDKTFAGEDVNLSVFIIIIEYFLILIFIFFLLFFFCKKYQYLSFWILYALYP